MSNHPPPDDFSDLAQLIAVAEHEADRDLERRSDPELVATERRRRRRRRISGAIVALVVVATIGTYLPLVLTAPLGQAGLESRDIAVEPSAPAAIVLPETGASAVSLLGADAFEGTSGTEGILAASGGNEARPIASITKVVTALVVLNAKPLALGDPGPAITFTEADEDLYDKYYLMGATIHPLTGGSSMSQRDALEVMIVPSATNYAEAVATWAFGSLGGFRRAAEAWLAAHGLAGTTIVEPTGMDPRNLSTPTDLIAIGKLALANPVVAQIVAMPALDVPGIPGASNRNTLLGIDGVTGIKTGTLDEAGSCLLYSATADVGGQSPITIVGIVLGMGSRESANAAVQAMLGSIRSGFHRVPAVARGDIFGTYSTPWGDEARIVAQNDGSVLTWSDTPVTAEVSLDSVTTAADGEQVGSVTLVAGAETQVVPLVLEGSINEPDGWWRITHPAEVFDW